MTITRLSEDTYLTKWANRIAPILGENFQVDLDGGLYVRETATDDEMARAAGTLLNSAAKTRQIQRIVDRFLGELISHYAIIKKCTWAEAIEALKLCETDGRAMRTLSKLPRIVERLDAETLSIPDLTTKHFDVATSFQGPSEERFKDKWNQGVKDILIEASECPSERGSRWVRDRMKNLQVECGVQVEQKDTPNDVMKAGLECALMLISWIGDEDFQRIGTERRLVADRFMQYANDALNRGLIDSPDDPVHYRLPWETKKVVEA